MAFANKYPGRCASCGAYVKAGKGLAFRAANGRWAVRCRSAACGRATETARPASQPQTRRLHADGSITMPYEEAALPLLRAMPGARWDRDARVWRVSTRVEDRPRVLELAERLRLEVDPEFRNIPDPPEVQEAKERAARAGAYPYQVEGVAWLALRRRALLADEMGLGKTLQALVALPARARALAIVPASLKYTWKSEVERWRPDLRPVVLSGRGTWQVPAEGEVVIANYDILPSWLVPAPRTQEITPPEGALDGIAEVCLILDEAHKVKSHKAKRSAKVAQLARRCGRVIAITGTPLLGRPLDLWGTLCSTAMAGEVYGNFKKFLYIFNGYKNRWGGYDFDRPRPEAGERLRRVMIRRRRDQVLPDLPTKTYREVVINGIPQEARERLDEIAQEWEAALAARELPPFEEIAHVRRLLAESRVPRLIEMVEDYEEADEPLVVFSAHRGPVDELAQREGWAAITGDTSPQRRAEIVERFQSGDLKGVALTIAAGGVGITLTRAHHVIFVDLDWTPANNAQAEDRVCRIGQSRGVVVTRLVSDHPVDQRIQEILIHKQELIDQVVERELPSISSSLSSAVCGSGGE